MNHFNKLREAFKNFTGNNKHILDKLGKTPTAKIIMLNTILYGMWKLRFIPEEFLVKNFAFDNFNLQQGRLHTFLTYSFSHTGLISYGFDMLMIWFLGNAVHNTYGGKYVYWLYILGTLYGGASMAAFQRPTQFIEPKTGPDSAIAAMISYIGLQNPRATFLFFMIPVPAWGLLIFLATYSLFTDPQKRTFSGMVAGLTVFQLMKFRSI